MTTKAQKLSSLQISRLHIQPKNYMSNEYPSTSKNMSTTLKMAQSPKSQVSTMVTRRKKRPEKQKSDSVSSFGTNSFVSKRKKEVKPKRVIENTIEVVTVNLPEFTMKK